MKKWIITFCLITVGIVSSAAGDDAAYKQSLLDLLDSTTNDTIRLRVLYDLRTLTKAQPEECLKYVDQLQKEAERQNNSYYLCQAYMYRMATAYNEYDTETVNKWMKLLEPLARKEKLYDILFFGKQCVVDMMLIKGEYEQQEKEVQKMLREATELKNITGIIGAYQSLAYNYRFTYRNKQAVEVLEKAYLLTPQSNDEFLNASIIRTLITECETLHDTQKWLKYTRAFENQIKKMIGQNPESAAKLRPDLMLVYVYYLNYYTYTGNQPQAIQASKKAKEYYSDSYSSAHRQLYNQAQYFHYKTTGAFEEALREAEAVLTATDTGFDVNYYGLLIHKARILPLLGREKEAITLYKKILRGKDSLQNVLLNRQTEQIKENYDTDTLLLEKEKIQRQTQLAFLIPLCLLIILLTYFIFHIYQIQRKLRKAEEEMGKMAGDVEQANIAKENFLSNISAAIRTPLDTIVHESLELSSGRITDKSEKDRLSEIINKTSGELMNLINDILMLSKLEAGVMKYSVGELEISTYLRSMAEMESFKNNVPIRVALPKNMEYEVQVDLNYFTQMVNSFFSATAEDCDEIVLSQGKTPPEQLQIIIQGCRLAAKRQTQEIMIRNEINRMLTKHFGGQYEVHTDSSKPYISLTLPVSRTINL